MTIFANTTIAPLLDSFAESVGRVHKDLRIARVPSASRSSERILLAPADRFADHLPDAQRARQADAGALPPEVYGEDLFEVLAGGSVRTWNGDRLWFADEHAARGFFARWLDPTTPEGRWLERCAERIRAGQAVTKKSRHVLASMREH